MFTQRRAWNRSVRLYRAPALAGAQRWRSMLAALLLFFCVGAGAEEPKLPSFFSRSWATENGLPDNSVTAIVQTHDGYLWLGTYGGLARFDGARFTVFTSANTPGLQSDRVTSLYEDGRHILWIGHERGDLTRYRNGKFESLDVHETGGRRKIQAISEDKEGEIWMLNEEGTLVRARDGATCALPNNNSSVQMVRDREGKLWVNSGGQLASLEKGLLTIRTNEGIGDFVQGICTGREGGLWVVSDGLVRKWNDHGLMEERGTNPCNSTVASIMETKSGCLVMGTPSDGLYMLFPNRSVLHFNLANGFANDWIRCAKEDREETLWVGAGSDGLVALRQSKVATLDAPDHWQGCVSLSIAGAHDGALWIGTEGAGLYRFLNGEWRNYSENAGFSNRYVWCVSEDAKGQIWAGTWGDGMFVQQGDRFVRPPGLEQVRVPMPAILHASDGVTWIGTVSGLIRYENGAVKWFGEKEGLKMPDVRAILQDPEGTVWFGMLGGGLGRLKNGRLDQFRKSDGLSSDYVQCLRLGGDGALWIGMYGSGLGRFKKGRFAKITTDEGLPNNFICGIEEDAHENFWISSHGGIFRVSQKALDRCAEGQVASVPCLSYGKGDGLPSLKFSGGVQPSVCKMADGRIWFPSSKGLVTVSSENAKVNELPPPIVIEEIVAGGRTLVQNPADQSSLKTLPDQRRFEFHYTGLSFVSPEKMQFQYRLEGWEKDWVDAVNNKRVADYSYIPPGNYIFRVRACNSEGVWNKSGVSIALSVSPHFWQTWWFRLVGTLAAASTGASSVWFVGRRRLRLKLERIERLQALERERARIAKDIHDHLGANLTRISLLSQCTNGELENPAQSAAQFDRIYNTSRELTRSMDEIVWAVDPQHDTLDSLASYLGNFAQEYLVSIKIRCRLDMPMHLPHWPITAETRHNVFLAFKEALHNIVKHSGANEVSTLLATDEAGFHLSIRDNGKGFDPATLATRQRRGNGLINMRQRLEKIGGRCETQSVPGAGTEIKFFVSVSSAARKNV